ncbi:nitroreductase family protein [candidate division KSB1 bacterium]|nr:nitroreductase family protein [candidate division KSB1 bacterium]
MKSIDPLIRKRHSARAIDPDRPVPDETLETLIEAARWAPSCFNNQPWRIVVSKDKSLPKVKECLSRGNGWAQDAPVIFTFASKPELGCQKTGRDYFPLDLGLAIENILLQGISMGLVMHPIAGFDEILLKESLRIPDEYRVHALVIVGHPLPAERMESSQREKEAQPSERKSAEEIVSWEGWPQLSDEKI